jgi:hypothetical protein
VYEFRSSSIYYGSDDTVHTPELYFPNILFNTILLCTPRPKRDEVTGEWRNLHSGDLHNLYSLPDIIRQIKSRRMRWAGHMARMEKGRNVYRVLVGKPEGKRPLGRPRRRWEDGIKMDLKEIGWGGVDSLGSK